jgi:hypothetical protein
MCEERIRPVAWRRRVAVGIELVIQGAPGKMADGPVNACWRLVAGTVITATVDPATNDGGPPTQGSARSDTAQLSMPISEPNRPLRPTWRLGVRANDVVGSAGAPQRL